MEKTTFTSVTFHHPFRLSGVEGPQEAGSYLVETVEQEHGTIQTKASRIVSMTMHITSRSEPGVTRLVELVPGELSAAMILDGVEPQPGRLN